MFNRALDISSQIFPISRNSSDQSLGVILNFYRFSYNQYLSHQLCLHWVLCFTTTTLAQGTIVSCLDYWESLSARFSLSPSLTSPEGLFVPQHRKWAFKHKPNHVTHPFSNPLRWRPLTLRIHSHDPHYLVLSHLSDIFYQPCPLLVLLQSCWLHHWSCPGCLHLTFPQPGMLIFARLILTFRSDFFPSNTPSKKPFLTTIPKSSHFLSSHPALGFFIVCAAIWHHIIDLFCYCLLIVCLPL